MNRRLAAFLFVTAVSLAACGGGGSSGASNAVTPPGSTPTSAPAASGNIPLSETAGTSSAWVDPSSHRTLVLAQHRQRDRRCVHGRLPVAFGRRYTPVSGSSGNANMTLITRSDGTGQQWAYQGHPLYHYTGDSGPIRRTARASPRRRRHWHVARPDAAAATPPPGGGPLCTGGYC